MYIAQKKDLKEISRFRTQIWLDYGVIKKEDFKKIEKMNLLYFRKMFRNKRIHIPMFKNPDREILSIGIGIILEKPPVNFEKNGMEGYIFNMFTQEEYRGKGLATVVLEEIMKFFRDAGIKKVILNSNASSRHLYLKNGFCENEYYLESVL